MKKSVVVLLIFIGSQFLAGCSHLVSKAANSFGDNLSSAMLNQDDPELVRAGMPSYILLILWLQALQK